LILAIIPARGGSKRLSQKNIRQVGGETLIERAILAAQGSQYIDNIILSSDKPGWKVFADRHEIEFDLRPSELAEDDSPIEDCVTRILRRQSKRPGIYDLVILLQPTSPLRTTEDIDRAIEIFWHPPQRLISFCDNKKNGAIYITRSIDLLWGESFSDSQGAQIFLMPPERSIDIDTEEDLRKAEALFKSETQGITD